LRDVKDVRVNKTVPGCCNAWSGGKGPHRRVRGGFAEAAEKNCRNLAAKD